MCIAVYALAYVHIIWISTILDRFLSQEQFSAHVYKMKYEITNIGLLSTTVITRKTQKKAI